MKPHIRSKSVSKNFVETCTGAWLGLAALTIMGAVSAAATESPVYVPLGSDDRVVIIDSVQDIAVGTIDGLPAVHGLAGTPDGRFLIAGSYRLRQADDGMPAKPSDVSEDEHAAHHGGSAAKDQAVGSPVSTVSVVRTDDGNVVRRIDVPGVVHHVAVNPAGTIAVVTHPDEGAITAIDLRSYEAIATVPTGEFPNYTTFGTDGRSVYVSNAGDATVTAVDTKTWTVQWSAEVGSSPEHVVLSPDGDTLYVNNVEGGTVSVVAVDKRKTVETLPVGATLHGIDLSDDGETLYVAALGDDMLTAIDLRTGSARKIALAPAPYHLAVVRGAGKLYVSSADEPKIWVVDQDTLAVLGEIQVGGKGHQMVLGAGS